MGVITAEHVILRPLRAADLLTLSFLGLIDQDDDVYNASTRWLEAVDRHGADIGGGWAIILRADERLVGMFLYGDCDAARGAALISYGLEAHARGRGLGSEAVAAAVDHVFATRAFDILYADVEPSNTASLRLLRKIGSKSVTAGLTPGVEVAMGWPARRLACRREQRTAVWAQR